MAKAKEPATEKFVETAQDLNFADPSDEAPELPPRGIDVERDIESIRSQRHAQRLARGPAVKRRKVTNYQDAERLRTLVSAGHTSLATPNEIVDWEEDGLLPNPAHYATGSSAAPLGATPEPEEGV